METIRLSLCVLQELRSFLCTCFKFTSLNSVAEQLLHYAFVRWSLGVCENSEKLGLPIDIFLIIYYFRNY